MRRLLALAWALAVAAAACGGSGPDVTTEPFADVAADVGIDFEHGAFRWDVSADPVAMMGGGVCWLDYDADGWLDLYAVNSYAEAEFGRWEQAGGLPVSMLFRNDGGSFTDVSAESGAGLQVRGNGCVAADFDLDGDSDLYVTTARNNALLWNQGDGTFVEGAVAAGIESWGWSTGAAVGDVDGDGWPDLFVAGYVDLNNRNPEADGAFPRSFLGRRDQLFLSEGGVTFTEVGEAVGLDSGTYEYGLGSLLTDVDADGDLDLYVANDTNPNRLYRNVADDGPLGFRFEEVGATLGVGDDNSGMGVAGGDSDGDGLGDLFVTNLGTQGHSYYTAGEPTFGAVPWLAGAGMTGWGATWGDFDLDADADLFVANGSVPLDQLRVDAQPVQFFANDAGGFAVTELDFANARGLAAADYDNDGDLDVAVGSVAGRLALLENTTASGHWLQVGLDRFAPGSRVVVSPVGGPAVVCEVHAGSSYLSSEDPRCHFGLGAADHVAEVLVTWPDGSETRLTDIAANQLLVAKFPG